MKRRSVIISAFLTKGLHEYQGASFGALLIAATAFLITLMMPSQLFGERIVVDSEHLKTEISDEAEVFPDATGRMTIEQAVAASYRPLKSLKQLGPASNVYWLRIAVHPSPELEQKWMLKIGSGWDIVDCYLPNHNGFEKLHSGDDVPPRHRPINSDAVVFPLQLSQTSDTTVYLRLQGDTSRFGDARNIDGVIESTRIFLRETRLGNYVQGLYAGIIIAMVGYNLIIFFATFDSTYFYYSLYMTSFGLVWMERAAFTYDYLWPNSPLWNRQSSFFLIAAAVVFSAFFVRNFLDTRKWFQFVDSWLLSVALITALIAILGLFAGVGALSPALAVDALATSVLYGAISIAMLVKGYRPARLFLAAWCTLIIANIVYILAYLSVIRTTSLTQGSVQVGSALECILLAFALGDRVKEIKSENENSQRSYTQQLEVEVKQRTSDLEQANARLQAASITDPLTGLKNRRFIDAIMPQMASEMKRRLSHGGPQDALLLCIADLDLFKQLNDTYGHDFGDEALKRTADALSRTIRASTVLARWGGEEFLLIDRVRPVDDDGRFAERMRTSIENLRLISSGGNVQLSISLGMARFPCSTRYPDLLNVEHVLAAADLALYHAKRHGRNCGYAITANEELLTQYVEDSGYQAATNFCREHLTEAIDRGLFQFLRLASQEQQSKGSQTL